METQLTTITNHRIPAIEDLICNGEAEITQLAIKRAKHLAQSNQPAPTGDKLDPYIGEIRTASEKLAAKFAHQLQPAKHLPQGKMDIDIAEEKVATLLKEIEAKQKQNQNDLYEIDHFNPKSFQTILTWGSLLTGIIFIGEILFNTKAFLITGDNLLFALIISFSISVAVALAAHVAAFLYKKAKNAFQRRLVTFISLAIMTIVFLALSMLRTAYLEKHDVHISPVYFVIFNLFFFIISSVASFGILPGWEAVLKNLHDLRIYKGVQKRKKFIRKLNEEKEKIKEIIVEKSKLRLSIIYYAKYGSEWIHKIHKHGVEAFKSTNLTYRSDKKTPDCFSDVIPEPDIEDITKLINFKNKPQ